MYVANKIHVLAVTFDLRQELEVTLSLNFASVECCKELEVLF